MFDWNLHLSETAQWLLTMANTPGWQEHAKLRRDQMLKEPMYREGLRAELNRLQEKSKK